VQELLPRPSPAPARRRKADDLSRLRIAVTRPTLWRVGAAIASGLLCAASRPPLDLGPLACVALVPLFLAWRGRSVRACAGYAFLAGAVYYSLLCSWIWYFGTVAIVPFVAACAAYWAGAGAMIGWFRRAGRFANPFVTAGVWIVADAGVARFPLGGISWGELGYAFHDIAPARAVASVGGLALVTFAAVAINAFVADLIVSHAQARRVGRALLGLTLVLAVVVVSTVTRAQPHVTRVMRVALVQGNDKNRDLTDAEINARYLPNSHFELAQQIRDPVDLIVFPESSMDADPRTDPYIRSNLSAIARKHHAWVLANATVEAPKANRRVNLDVLFTPDGEIAGTYAKRHLVPYGEYVPFRGLIEGLVPAVNQVPEDFVRGKGPGLFDIAGTRVGTLICFESAFGYQVRPVVHDGAQMLVVSTNNRSYRRSANSAQHLAIGQMRAAETGRPVVQSAISGITAVIDADGVVHDRTHLFDRTVVETTVAATSGQTPYVRWGEWVTIICIGVVSVLVVLTLLRRRRRPALVESSDESPVTITADERRDGCVENLEPTLVRTGRRHGVRRADDE
jgi:apolipoprotein N-acyltransferase